MTTLQDSHPISRLSIAVILVFSSLVTTGQEAWHLYKEAPKNLIPLQLEQANDGTIYMLSTQRYMYYLEPGAEAWAPIANVQGWWNHDNFAIDPVTERIFVGTSLNGLRYTDNLGADWELEYFFTNPNGFHASIPCIATNNTGNIVLMGSNGDPDVGNANYRSTNGGNSWSTLNSPTSFKKLFIRSNGDILGASLSSGLFISTNNGSSWTALGMTTTAFTDFAETDDGIIFATAPESTGGMEPGVFVSSDDGQSWFQLNNGLNEVSAQCISYNSMTHEVVLGTQEGLYRLNGNVWIQDEAPFTGYGVNDVLARDEGVYAGTPFYAIQFSNSANNWNNRNEGLTGGISQFIWTEDEHVLAANGSGIGYSVVEGQVSEWVNHDLEQFSQTFLNIQQMERGTNSEIFFLDFDELFRSNDNGQNFDNITPDLPMVDGSWYRRFSRIALALDGELMMSQSSDDHLYHSTDGGDSFQLLMDSTAIEGLFVVEEFTKSSSGNYYCVILSVLGRSLYHSANGQDWSQVDISETLANGSGIGLNLDLMASGQVVFTVNHIPYIIDETDNSFDAIEVPWTMSNPNAYFDFTSDSQGNMFITAFATFSDIDYEGIWRSSNGGSTWTNIGLPISTDNEELSATGLRFNGNNTPFVIAGSISEQNHGLYYYGEEGIFLNLFEPEAPVSILSLYPNPSPVHGHIAIEHSEIGIGDSFIIYDIKGSMVKQVRSTTKGWTILQSEGLHSGTYQVLWIQEEQAIGHGRLVIE